MGRGPGRRLTVTMLIVPAVLVLLFGLAVWAAVRGLSDPVQTEASNEVLDATEPADLTEVGRSSEGNGGYTLVRTYELGGLHPEEVVRPPSGFVLRGDADHLDDRHWDTVLTWDGPSPKGEGDCVIWAAVSRSTELRPQLLRLTVSCLALDAPGV